MAIRSVVNLTIDWPRGAEQRDEGRQRDETRDPQHLIVDIVWAITQLLNVQGEDQRDRNPQEQQDEDNQNQVSIQIALGVEIT